MFTKISPQKMTTLVVLLVVLAGVGLGAFGIYQYFDARQKISENFFYVSEQEGYPTDPKTGERIAPEILAGKAIELRESEIEYYRLDGQRADSIKYIGVALALVGVAWLGHDFISSRRKRQSLQDDAQPLAEEVQASSSST